MNHTKEKNAKLPSTLEYWTRKWHFLMIGNGLSSAFEYIIVCESFY